MMLIDCATPAGIHSTTDDLTLTARVCALAAKEREARADFIENLAEFDRRRLYLGAGFPSLFAWLTDKLRFSNASAYRRTTAARLAARMPVVLRFLREGRVSLAKLCLLKDVLAPDSCLALLEKAASMSEKEVEDLALALDPAARAKPPSRDSIRPVSPAPKPSSAEPQRDLFSAVPASAAEAPMASAPVRHVITMTVGPELMTLLEETRAALSHTHGGASLEAIFSECMTRTVAAHRKRSRAETDKPRAGASDSPPHDASRYIPAHVRRAVWSRDRAQCTFVSDDGRPCGATHLLQVHHEHAHGRGGPPTVENLRLLCAAHNDLMARAEYGNAHMDRFRPESS